MRTVFFGTPAIAVPAMQALAATTELVGVVCQPDRPAGRGLRLAEPPVKAAARALGIEAHQPVKVRTGTLDRWLAERGVEAVLVMAYGRILPPGVLAAPPCGCLNLHASLLPRYRGAAPINWAIIRGEEETGISLMKMDEGMDTGPVFCMRRLSIGPEETAGELGERLAALAAVVVREDLPVAVSGEQVPSPQDEAVATFAPPITKAMTAIDWQRPATEIASLVRGLAPRPGAQTRLRGKLLKILAASIADAGSQRGWTPGDVVAAEGDAIVVGTGLGCVRLLRAQPEGKKAQGPRDLVNGRVLRPGDRFES